MGNLCSLKASLDTSPTESHVGGAKTPLEPFNYSFLFLLASEKNVASRIFFFV